MGSSEGLVLSRCCGRRCWGSSIGGSGRWYSYMKCCMDFGRSGRGGPPNLKPSCEDTGIFTLHWRTYGYFWTIRTRKSMYGYFRNLHTHTTHRSHTHFTRHIHDWQAQFTRPVSTRNLHDTYKIYKHTLRAYNLRPHLRVQSMPSNYVYNIRAQLTRTTYVSFWRARIIRLSLACTCYTYNLRAWPTRYVTWYVLVWRARIIRCSLGRTYLL